MKGKEQPAAIKEKNLPSQKQTGNSWSAYHHHKQSWELSSAPEICLSYLEANQVQTQY